jgi:hypothetical protein
MMDRVNPSRIIGFMESMNEIAPSGASSKPQETNPFHFRTVLARD